MAAAAAPVLNRLHSASWRVFDGYVTRASARWAGVAERVLGREGRRVVAAFEAGGEAAAIAAVAPAAWFDYLSRVWLSVVPDGFEMVDSLVLKAANREATRAAVNWLRTNGAARAEVISETSREGIRNQIRIGVSKGETQTQIAERIGKHYRSIDAGRASRIARTEVHAAANYGSLSAAEGSSEPLRKRWLATPDNRTRDTHEDAHYQGRGLSQPFEVGNAWLMYPGDTSMGAGPEEVINCRCSLGYERIAPRRKPRRAA